MKISVVTPSLNQGTYIEETIRSVLSQEGDFSLDYIVMDGGSTDSSPEIISRYAGQVADGSWEKRCREISFRWTSARDGGHVDAIKKGFAAATGDVLCWLNSDDVYLDGGVLQRVTDMFSQDPALGWVTGDGLFIDAQGKELGVHHVDRIRLRELLFLDYHILQPASFVRREVYRPGQLDESIVCAFDADYFIGLVTAGVPYRKTDERLAGFRIYPEIKTLRLAPLRYREQLRIARKYSRNWYYYLISAVYRYFEIVLQARYGHRRLFRQVFTAVYDASYRLILGKNAGRRNGAGT